MKLGTRICAVAAAAVLTVVTLGVMVSDSSAFTLRTPQIAFGSSFLQGFMNGRDGGISVLTDQVDAQVFTTNFTGNTEFTLVLESSSGNEIGVYDGGTIGAPALYQLFPPAAVAGWFVACHFDISGSLTAFLYDNSNPPVFQGSTTYSGVTRNKLGFYIKSGCGTFYSQDWRNPGGKPQVLTFAGTGTNYGDWFECFDSCPYGAAYSTFTSEVLMLQSVNPVPTRMSSWGALKSSYR